MLQLFFVDAFSSISNEDFRRLDNSTRRHPIINSLFRSYFLVILANINFQFEYFHVLKIEQGNHYTLQLCSDNSFTNNRCLSLCTWDQPRWNHFIDLFDCSRCCSVSNVVVVRILWQKRNEKWYSNSNDKYLCNKIKENKNKKQLDKIVSTCELLIYRDKNQTLQQCKHK